MNLSRAACKQLLALDLVEGVIDATRRVNRSNAAVDQVLRRISRLQGCIRSSLASVNDQGGIIFDDHKQYRRYQRIICQARDTFLNQWSGEHLDGREYLSAVLLYLDEVWRQAGKVKDELGQMIDELHRLYEMMDPGLCADPQMDVGQEAGERLVGMMA